MSNLESDPANRKNWLDYMNALYLAGQIDAARRIFELAKGCGLHGHDVDEMAARLFDTSWLGKPVASEVGRAPHLQDIERLLSLFNHSRYDDAEALARSMQKNHPSHGLAYKVLGAVLMHAGRYADALFPMQNAATLVPSDAGAHCNLGLIFHELGRQEEAVQSCRYALQINPEMAEAHNNMGIVMHSLRRYIEAEASYRLAIKIHPTFAAAYNNLGRTLQETARFEEAEHCYRRALELNPEYAEALSNFASLLFQKRCLSEAEMNCRKAIEINPYCVGAYTNLATIQLDSGRVDDAVESLRKSLEIRPEDAALHSNLIFAMDLSSKTDMIELLQERRNWDAVHGTPFYRNWSHENKPDPERKLRIGYVPADFRMHSAAFVFGGVLVNYDARQFDVVAYSNSSRKDGLTEKFYQSVTIWRDIAGISDGKVAELIRDDGIDILVDLSGHSAGNRLQVIRHEARTHPDNSVGLCDRHGNECDGRFFHRCRKCAS